MRDLEATNILEIAQQVGATELFIELNKYLFNRDFEIINIKEFLKLCVNYDLDEIDINKFLNGNIMDRLDSNIYFHGSEGLNQILPHGYIGIVHEVIINDKKFKMLVVGELSKDYEYFYKGII